MVVAALGPQVGRVLGQPPLDRFGRAGRGGGGDDLGHHLVDGALLEDPDLNAFGFGARCHVASMARRALGPPLTDAAT